jgi:hypothetical protein
MNSLIQAKRKGKSQEKRKQKEIEHPTEAIVVVASSEENSVIRNSLLISPFLTYYPHGQRRKQRELYPSPTSS